MRLRFTLLISAAALLMCSRPAAASDAGDDVSSSEGGVDDASAASDADVAPAADASDLEVGDGGQDAGVTPVIACDGALCDTTQGRPTCAVASGAIGRAAVDATSIASLLVVLIAALSRRAKRGTSRPA